MSRHVYCAQRIGDGSPKIGIVSFHGAMHVPTPTYLSRLLRQVVGLQAYSNGAPNLQGDNENPNPNNNNNNEVNARFAVCQLRQRRGNAWG
jgi:hypothetical protein